MQNKILFGIFKIKYYFENTILHITGRRWVYAYIRLAQKVSPLRLITLVYLRHATLTTWRRTAVFHRIFSIYLYQSISPF